MSAIRVIKIHLVYSSMLHRDYYHTATGHADVTFIAVPREIEVNYERVCRASCIVRVRVYTYASVVRRLKISSRCSSDERRALWEPVR